MSGKDSASLNIAKDGDVDTTSDIRNLASKLYNNNYSYNSEPIIKVNDVKYDNAIINIPEEYYLLNDELCYQPTVETNREEGGKEI